MQSVPQEPLSTSQHLLYLLATLIAGGLGAFLTWVINRQKVPVEITAIHASTEKTLAEARHLDGVTLQSAYKRIDDLHCIVDELREDLERVTVERNEAVRDKIQAEADRALMEYEMGRMKSAMDLGLTWAELDKREKGN